LQFFSDLGFKPEMVFSGNVQRFSKCFEPFGLFWCDKAILPNLA
jgi:hypothetical protein